LIFLYKIMKDEIKKEIEEAIESDQKSKQNDTFVNKLIDSSANPPKVDDLVNGTVIGIEKSAIYIDIPPFGTGIIFGKASGEARSAAARDRDCPAGCRDCSVSVLPRVSGPEKQPQTSHARGEDTV
jgi:hypothetical protein